jgi:hypothetical protein
MRCFPSFGTIGRLRNTSDSRGRAGGQPDAFICLSTRGQSASDWLQALGDFQESRAFNCPNARNQVSYQYGIHHPQSRRAEYR